MIAALGLFALYLIPSWSRRVSRITDTPRMPFGWLLFLAVITLGIALSVTQIKYALALTRHGQRIGYPGTNPQLGSWVFVLTVVSLVWSIGTLGIGFLLGGFAMAVYATVLVQCELNEYDDMGEPSR